MSIEGHEDVELANRIAQLLADEPDVDTRIMALTICLLRLKIHGHVERACPEGQAVVHRLLKALSPA